MFECSKILLFILHVLLSILKNAPCNKTIRNVQSGSDAHGSDILLVASIPLLLLNSYLHIVVQTEA